MVITRGDRVLMGKEVSPKDPRLYMWETPGGGLCPGETLEQCLVREASEEIGVGVSILNEMPRFRSIPDTVSGQDPSVHWLLVYCRCEAMGEPDLARAADTEFAELRFVGQCEFTRLLGQGSIAHGERQYLPGVMVELGLWAPA
jgi:8-oxo-dGTP pyrophosphatase MutT (NUDIX family)